MDEMLKQLLSYVQGTELFLLKETPLFIKELIAYNVYFCKFEMATISIIVVVLSFTCWIIVAIESYDCDILKAVIITATIISWVIFSVMIPVNILILKKIEMAPKVFIVDYLSDKLKTE